MGPWAALGETDLRVALASGQVSGGERASRWGVSGADVNGADVEGTNVDRRRTLTARIVRDTVFTVN